MTEPVGILIDTTRCIGCECCVEACKKVNGLGPDLPWRGQEAVTGLSATRFSTVLRRGHHHFVLQQCRHCLDPACVSACLVGAMQKTPEGPVIYDPDRCMGCRYCLVACPYGIPRYQWNDPVPHVGKCIMCYPRLKEGKLPACVEACPEHATIFGPRAQLLEEAHRRIAADPGTYVQRVFGEHDVGGTSVLYISDASLDFLSWRGAGDAQPLPALTWASLERVPPIFVIVGGLMGGIRWVIGRRMRIAAEEGRGAGGGGAESGKADPPHD